MCLLGGQPGSLDPPAAQRCCTAGASLSLVSLFPQIVNELSAITDVVLVTFDNLPAYPLPILLFLLLFLSATGVAMLAGVPLLGMHQGSPGAGRADGSEHL